MAGETGAKGATSRGKGPGGSNARPIIIVRRIEEAEAGHHGGAWKVAYADFVTAMMAFFLLLWLLNATTETQRVGLADYFSPANALSHASSGTGKPFGGSTPFDRGSLVSNKGVAAAIPGRSLPAPQTRAMHDARTAGAAGAGQTPRPAAVSANGTGGEKGRGAGPAPQPHGAPGPDQAPNQARDRAPGGSADQAAANTAQALGRAAFLANAGIGGPHRGLVAASQAAQEHAAFKAAAAEIRAAIAADPALRDLAGQLRIDQTRRGLRIQLLDANRTPMFASGGIEPARWAREVLARVAPVLAKLPEQLAITGHTDAAPYQGDAPGMSNWDLSAARANAARRLLLADGIESTRFRSVTGMADRELLLPDRPFAAANRRIAITVLRASEVP